MPDAHEHQNCGKADQQHLRGVSGSSHPIATAPGCLHEEKERILEPHIPLVVGEEINIADGGGSDKPTEAFEEVVAMEVDHVEVKKNVRASNKERPVHHEEGILDEPVHGH